MRASAIGGLLILTIMLSACGSGTSKAVSTPLAQAATATASATSAPTVAATPTVITLTAQELSTDKYVFTPNVLSVRAGQQVTVHYINPASNQRPHTFELKTADGSGDIVKSAQVQPGGTLDIQFTVPAAGTYQFLCYQRGHADKGQTGTLSATAS